MKYFAPNTLAYYQSAPQVHRVDLSEIPLRNFAKSTLIYRLSCGEVSPDAEAIQFYALNHLQSIARKNFTPNENLAPWAAEVCARYSHTLTSQGQRILHYLFCICTREARHAKTPTQANWDKLEKEFGVTMVNFLRDRIFVGSETTAVNAYMETPPDVTAGTYIKALSWVFHNLKWSSGLYGGAAWGAITDACVAFITGKTSMEALVDTGYTLAHNNGPMFNKGMMYYTYTSQFLTILDIQRSGQIPELVLDTTQKYYIDIPKDIKGLVEQVRAEYPSEFRGYVDWVKVEELGAVGKYSNYKQAQLKAHPEVKAAPKPEYKLLAGKKTKVVYTGSWGVMPGLTAQVFERVKK